MEPLVFGIGRGAMDGFPLDESMPLDIVPVDTAINSILAAIAATGGKPGTHVYQIGTSQCNPLREWLPFEHQSTTRMNCGFKFVSSFELFSAI